MDFERKIKSREELSKISLDLRTQGKIIGFTSGAFDILHAGHVDYLQKAKAQCDCLIVGVNSDISVKSYKGDERPIIPESARVNLISSLEFVDYAFLFDERKNKDNLESLKPHLYIKAGDYKEEELTSAVYLEPWNGRVVLIPVKEQISTSSIIEKISILSKKNSEASAVSLDNPPQKKSFAVFLDRDGVINEEVHFLHEPEKFKLLPNVAEALKKLKDMNYKLVIITNQGGIGLGYFTKEDFFKVNSEMFRQVSKEGIKIDKIYFCPHSLSENCDCRKPKTALFERAKKDLNIDVSKSFMIGDKTEDILAGKNAGTKTILVQTGYAGRDGNFNILPDYTAKDLLDAAEFIKQAENFNIVDFSKIKTYPIKDRILNKESITQFPKIENKIEIFPNKDLEELAERVVESVKNNRKVAVMIGGHVIKTGMSPYLIDLMKKGVINHIAMNGATSIHDFEIAIAGETSEDVEAGIANGTFGMADETGRFMNTAIIEGAEKGFGYGYSIGKKISDLNFPNKEYSILYNAYQLKIPATVHVAIGTDIIHQHPVCDGAALGKASYTDFKKFVSSLTNLGTIINIGSAVVLPEVFLKAITIVRNLGYDVKDITTANLDMINHYRPRVNIVERPPKALGGKGFMIIGKHQELIPSLYNLIIQKLPHV
ncbi:MAG: HAD-IIIA family hydrolase [Nanoarchaeota archaeon]|nr:HAD-IIIA family hydrolase [Nanoarchaeota archaeon]